MRGWPVEPPPTPPSGTLSSPCPAVGAPELEVSSLLTPGTQMPRLQPAPPPGPGRQAERVASEGLGSGSSAHGERQQEIQSVLGKTSLMRSWIEQKNVGLGVRGIQVQTLALPLKSCSVALDKRLQISLSLSFLPVKQA